MARKPYKSSSADEKFLSVELSNPDTARPKGWRTLIEISFANGRRLKVPEDIDLRRLQALILTVEAS